MVGLVGHLFCGAHSEIKFGQGIFNFGVKMRIDTTLSQITFENKSILKTEFERGRIPLKKDITGHKLKKGYESVDHTIPKSKGGKSNLYNYSLMDTIANNKRGNKPLKPFIDLESLVEYISVMLDVKTPDLDGVDYVKKWLKVLLKAFRENK